MRARLSFSRDALREREAGFFCAMRSLVLPLCDEACRRAQHIALRTDRRKCCVRLLQQVLQAALGAINAQLRDEGGLAECRILASGLAARRGVAFNVEPIDGAQEGFADRMTISVERRVLLLRGLTEPRARDAAIF